MGFSLSKLNKTVQESGLYKKIKPFIYEEGLGAEAKERAIKAMEASTQKKIKTMADSGQINNTVEDVVNKAAIKYSNTDKGLDSLSAWKGMSGADQKSVREAARARVLGENYTADKAGNIDEYVDQYSGAVNAVKRRLNAKRASEAIKGYYMNPLNDGRLGTAAVRASGTIGTTVGAGAIVNSITSDPYSSNY